MSFKYDKENLFKEFDPYLNFIPTLWLIHWKLCSNINQTTTFYYTFNYFTSLANNPDNYLELAGRTNQMQDAEKLIIPDIDKLTKL